MYRKNTLLAFIVCCFTCNGQLIHPAIEKAITDPQSTIKEYSRKEALTASDAATNNFLLGKCHAFLNHEDTALVYFIKAKKEFEKIGETSRAKEIALDAYLIVSSQENYDRFGKGFLEEYFTYAKQQKSSVMLAYSYNEFAKNAAAILSEKKASRSDSAMHIYRKALHFALASKDSLILAKVYANMATLETDWGKYDQARVLLNKSRKYLRKNLDDFDLFANYFNYGNSFFYQTDYNKALEWFTKAEKVKVPYYGQKSLCKLYGKMTAANDSLGNDKMRQHYQKLYMQLSSNIKLTEQNIGIHATEVKQEVQKKNAQIHSLQQFKMKFIHNKILFSILLFLVFLLALYSFVRWKKVDHRKRKLEKEKENIEIQHLQTVEQLEKVRQLVIEDHIVLKNKTRLYLDKLLYIKAEDHYLHFVSSDAKSHLLRGKLTEIQSQLPPNFVKCHRSYIVNSNFIKNHNSKEITLSTGAVIPISRDFRL